ncbi:nitrate- and nitrite sensing domain-containing protein [Streptomyces radicis]|uniref:histidine kinase n=1 Tax=Streptomyces radicis TaxID=1750517 RepID=A0A3A9WJP8_9ACTN|nr:nitrate- and nitrite sensing domain-containing protein [Streptomyces radicis]RKN12563.1 HAMP domain-containing protein [Streptomyces radicis]RKN27671.1 HAMP domain-containing protein [Streptomyces radicis]
MRFRGTSVRRRTAALMLVPLLSLVSVWAVATFITVSDARSALAASDAADFLTGPTQGVIGAVQAERRQSLLHLGDPRRAEELSRLQDLRAATDEAMAGLRDAAGRGRGDLGGTGEERLDALLAALDDLDQLRDQVDSNTIDRPDLLDAYSGVTGPGLGLLAVLPPGAGADNDRRFRAVVGLAQAREHLSQEDALAAGALAAGVVTTSELRGIDTRIVRRETAYETFLPDLPVDDRQAHESFWDSGRGRILVTTEEGLLEGGAPVVPADHWADAATGALESLGELADEARGAADEDTGPAVTGAVWRAVLVGGVGLVAVVVSAVVALRVGRGLDRDLQALSREARDAAELRLPGVMRRLDVGEHVDVETEAPRLEYPPDEVGEIGRALNTLQREAVSAAVERAETRRGVSEVFVNLARRNQVLLHRQLGLLEALERRTETADELTDLVRADHIATRMRRHAEGLVILSGAAPARQWRKPEQLMDVVRAAVDEVEEYERVEIHRLPPLAVTGGAVADLTHLVAELLENATVFSPPHTAVQVTGERVPHGFTLEIHDRGLGMTAEALREANQRLAETPEFELSHTDRIGLFVVSRLADRHGIRVALRDSPYGGTTAVTLIPGELLTETAEEPPERERLPRSPHRPALLHGPMDGPVELEAPVGPDDHDPAAEPPVEHTAAQEPDTVTPLPRLPQRRAAPVLVSDHGRTVGPPPEAEQEARGPARHRQQRPGTEGTTGAGLPRRARHAAPAGPVAPAASVPAPGSTREAEAPPELDAEQVRSRMAALQRGWRLGRQQSEPDGDDSPPLARP